MREKILGKKRLRRLAPGTITDPSELAAELDRVKTQGYACSLGEQVADAGAVAAPIFGPENRFLGALSIVGPITRFTPDTLPRRIKLIVVSASALSRKLCPAYPCNPRKRANRRAWESDPNSPFSGFQRGSGEGDLEEGGKASLNRGAEIFSQKEEA